MSDPDPEHATDRSAETTPPATTPSATTGDGSPERLSPENLPPVQPPSAGFILQLFVVPALIVGAVILVSLLFGRLASNDTDWQRQVDEIKQSNVHRRWRGAESLAAMLKADALAGEDGEQLARNPELARQLVEQAKSLINNGAKSPEDSKIETYLLHALGWLDSDEIVFPTLVEAMQDGRSLDSRFNATYSASNIASRRWGAAQPLADGILVEELLSNSRDSDPALRRISARALGFCTPVVSQDRLVVLLEDGDSFVRANAAMSLSLQRSTRGLPVLEQILKSTVETPDPLANYDRDDPQAEQRANAEEIDLRQKALNALRAIGDLAPQLSASEKGRVRPYVQSLADDFRDVKIQIAARDALQKLNP